MRIACDALLAPIDSDDHLMSLVLRTPLRAAINASQTVEELLAYDKKFIGYSRLRPWMIQIDRKYPWLCREVVKLKPRIEDLRHPHGHLRLLLALLGVLERSDTAPPRQGWPAQTLLSDVLLSSEIEN